MSLPMPSSRNTPVVSNPHEIEAMEKHLIALASQSGGDLRKLFYAFFGFLHRRTDFYVVSDKSQSKMGFKEGDAEKVLLASFRQFPLRKMKPGTGDDTASKSAANPAPAPTVAPKAAQTSTTTKPSPPPDDENLADPMANIRLTDEGLQIPVGNGGSTEDYKWTQTIDETSVLVGIPDNLRAKDLSVAIKPSSVSVKTKSGDHTFVNGTLTHKIVPDESTWTMEGGVLVLVLYKQQKTFWKTVIEGDDEIDATMVDSRRHIDEYDSATQAQIRKILFDQNQARQGKESSDEISGVPPPDPASLKMPPGVEYIDSAILDEKTRKK